jgi:hypothetical protein
LLETGDDIKVSRLLLASRRSGDEPRTLVSRCSLKSGEIFPDHSHHRNYGAARAKYLHF